jgi:crotonobetainyl-CoA:carnitine CoA-transferase CaiB-like acyl-CoA transferase
VETSLLESLIDFQFEVLTTYLNDGRRPPRRSSFRNAHSYLSAPYGVYDTKNGHLALAMMHLPTLGSLLGIPELAEVKNSADAFRRRDEIKRLIADRLRQDTSEHWLGILDAADIWCSEVLDWPKLLASAGFQELRMLQTVVNGNGLEILTTRCPFRIDGEVLSSAKAAAKVGEQTAAIAQEFDL